MELMKKEKIELMFEKITPISEAAKGTGVLTFLNGENWKVELVSKFGKKEDAYDRKFGLVNKEQWAKLDRTLAEAKSMLDKLAKNIRSEEVVGAEAAVPVRMQLIAEKTQALNSKEIEKEIARTIGIIMAREEMKEEEKKIVEEKALEVARYGVEKVGESEAVLLNAENVAAITEISYNTFKASFFRRA
ncbi:MAG: hypothetical protein ABIH99_05530 [Candidatus Micrarchaeota archaeon]